MIDGKEVTDFDLRLVRDVLVDDTIVFFLDAYPIDRWNVSAEHYWKRFDLTMVDAVQITLSDVKVGKRYGLLEFATQVRPGLSATFDRVLLELKAEVDTL
jgi:hypothetical protein